MAQPDPERQRLADTAAGTPWQLWGPYLAERQWGTVREDYSGDGSAWTYFPHEQARSRAYRWGEDGLLGICDEQARLCFGLALWNGADLILKERLFGLTGPEGNHGEDVKESYFFLDSTPTHSYMRALYKYPQRAFPYDDLLKENGRRGRDQPEYELVHTGIFDDQRYFDVFVEYAKASPTDIVVRIEAVNRRPEPAVLHLLPTLWFRNTWSWGRDARRPRLLFEPADASSTRMTVRAEHHGLGSYWLACDGTPRLLFTENESNAEHLWGTASPSPYVKDAFHRAIVSGETSAVNPVPDGTKAAAHYQATVAAGASFAVTLRLSGGWDSASNPTLRVPSRRGLPRAGRLSAVQHADPFADAEEVLASRRAEADRFYDRPGLDEETQRVQRQAFAGLLWSKQYYNYDVDMWLDGDPGLPAAPVERQTGRNADWGHLNNGDVIAMPDTWEYPWYAAWDLAFHCVPLALVDPEFAKHQLLLLLREWYLHPNGQLPAYEWAFGDVNPPVHAWAAWRVYKIETRITGRADRAFLERIFHKLLLNFTWWVNRKDREGNNVFEGGFLGLDNIAVFDRSKLPTGGHLEQSDGTAWMGMYCLNLLAIALELARENRVYEDVATKFLEHFLYFAGAMNKIGGDGFALWDDEDEFFYDVLHLPNGDAERLRARSLVGLIPLLAVETIEPDLLEAMPEFRARLEWFLEHRPELAGLVSRWSEPGAGERRLFALVRGHRMKRLLSRMLDPEEFLSDYGVRSLSRAHLNEPYSLTIDGTLHTIRYEPAESAAALYGATGTGAGRYGSH